MLAPEEDRVVEVGGRAFGGGTWLVSGHRLVDRYSDDLDVYSEPLGRRARTALQRRAQCCGRRAHRR